MSRNTPTDAMAAFLIEIKDSVDSTKTLHEGLRHELGRLRTANLGRAFDLIEAEKQRLELHKRELTSRDYAMIAAENASKAKWKTITLWSLIGCIPVAIALLFALWTMTTVLAPRTPRLCQAFGGVHGTHPDNQTPYCVFWPK